jgi:hypothetical protein
MTGGAIRRDKGGHAARRDRHGGAELVMLAGVRTGVADRVHQRQSEQRAEQQNPPGDPPGRSCLLSVHRFTLARDREIVPSAGSRRRRQCDPDGNRTVLIMIGMIAFAPRAIARYVPKSMTVADLPALTDGYSAALLGAAGIAGAAAVLAAITLTGRRAVPAATETDTAPATR